MDNYISRPEHDEMLKRMEDENNRQNHRISLLEDSVKTLISLTASVEKLAITMDSMLKEQEKQGARLQELENRDGDMWRTVVKYILSAIIGIAIGYLSKGTI